ncbi:MAG: hypothetical protein HFG86_14760, partial [Dorea sp.]|nr:hypothetical protein [Dorea sp.]
FDFDFNLIINNSENHAPKDIRLIIKKAIDQVVPKYGYKYCEDSTRVLTIKKVDVHTCKILYSCDFALIRNCNTGKQQYIRYNKKDNNYTWEFQSNGFKNRNGKILWLKSNKYWNEFKDYYIEKKNHNTNLHKHSHSIFVESVNEMYQKKRH